MNGLEGGRRDMPGHPRVPRAPPALPNDHERGGGNGAWPGAPATWAHTLVLEHHECVTEEKEGGPRASAGHPHTPLGDTTLGPAGRHATQKGERSRRTRGTRRQGHARQASERGASSPHRLSTKLVSSMAVALFFPFFGAMHTHQTHAHAPTNTHPSLLCCCCCCTFWGGGCLKKLLLPSSPVPPFCPSFNSLCTCFHLSSPPPPFFF